MSHFGNPHPYPLAGKVTEIGLKGLCLGVSPTGAHINNLTTILGVKDEEICQVNVFPLYALGTAKKTTLTPSRSHCGNCLA